MIKEMVDAFGNKISDGDLVYHYRDDEEYRVEYNIEEKEWILRGDMVAIVDWVGSDVEICFEEEIE